MPDVQSVPIADGTAPTGFAVHSRPRAGFVASHLLALTVDVAIGRAPKRHAWFGHRSLDMSNFGFLPSLFCVVDTLRNGGLSRCGEIRGCRYAESCPGACSSGQ